MFEPNDPRGAVLAPVTNLFGECDDIDCQGMTVMPGMIDSHVHVTASSADLRKPAFMTPVCSTPVLFPSWRACS